MKFNSLRGGAYSDRRCSYLNTILLIDFHLHSVSLINALMITIFIFFFLVSVVDRAS
jgi:hypothetical protein